MPVVEYADKSIPIVLFVLVNGAENVKIFSFKFKFAIVAYVEVAVLLNKYELKFIPIVLVVLVNGAEKVNDASFADNKVVKEELGYNYLKRYCVTL